MIVQGYLLSIKHPEHYPENPVVFINSLCLSRGNSIKGCEGDEKRLDLDCRCQLTDAFGQLSDPGGTLFQADRVTKLAERVESGFLPREKPH